MINFRFLLLTLSFSPLGLLANECSNNINATTPEFQFSVNSDGTATDSRTGLRWQRCPAGYQLDDKGNTLISDDSCEPEDVTTFDWQAALEYAIDINNNGGGPYTDWRVPNIKELASIVEYKCYNPAINLRIFPDADAEKFWSSTPRSINAPAIIDFNLGTYSYSYIDIVDLEYKFYVRLVRTNN